MKHHARGGMGVLARTAGQSPPAIFHTLCVSFIFCGPVAQLDSALVFGTKGWGFKSLRGRQQTFPFTYCVIAAGDTL